MPRQQIIHNVPVFPLRTVLFPQTPLALHVFEERYKTMIKDLGMGDNRFCVALIEEGQEVGGDANPYKVGCLAEITHLQPLQDGRYFLVATGLERVRIVSTGREGTPYLTASIELWPDELSSPAAALAARAARLFKEYARCLMEVTDQKLDDLTLPADSSNLSYMLATVMQMSPEARQGLLELPDAASRLEAELDLLKSELPILHAIAHAPKPPDIGNGRFSAN